MFVSVAAPPAELLAEALPEAVLEVVLELLQAASRIAAAAKPTAATGTRLTRVEFMTLLYG
jgi:hypothetical protein